MIQMVDHYWVRAQGENTTSASGVLSQATAVFQPAPISVAVFHRVLAQHYETLADETTKRDEKRACLNASLHHYLEAYAQEAP